MEFGAHIPVVVGAGERPRLRDFTAYALAAERLGYRLLGANDHLASRTGWLDGPSILTAAAAVTERILLATTILLPALRHPVVVAKTYGTLDSLTGGRVVVGVGAGVLPADFALAGIPLEERWGRLDESIAVMRALWREPGPVYEGRYYRLDGVGLQPLPARPGGPPIWVGSWGSPAGLRRAARLGDGWITSGFNTTPERFARDWDFVQGELARLGRDSSPFANALSSLFCYVTVDEAEAERVAREVVGPAMGRSAEEMLASGLFGPAGRCAARLRAYREAGLQLALIWPAAEPLAQLRRFAEEVMPLV